MYELMSEFDRVNTDYVAATVEKHDNTLQLAEFADGYKVVYELVLPVEFRDDPDVHDWLYATGKRYLRSVIDSGQAVYDPSYEECNWEPAW